MVSLLPSPHQTGFGGAWLEISASALVWRRVSRPLLTVSGEVNEPPRVASVVASASAETWAGDEGGRLVRWRELNSSAEPRMTNTGWKAVGQAGRVSRAFLQHVCPTRAFSTAPQSRVVLAWR